VTELEIYDVRKNRENNKNFKIICYLIKLIVFINSLGLTLFLFNLFFLLSIILFALDGTGFLIFMDIFFFKILFDYKTKIYLTSLINPIFYSILKLNFSASKINF